MASDWQLEGLSVVGGEGNAGTACACALLCDLDPDLHSDLDPDFCPLG